MSKDYEPTRVVRVAKHFVFMQSKENVSSETMDEVIKGFSNLAINTENMKEFKWGTNCSSETFDADKFTHVFEATFETEHEVKQFVASKAHVDLIEKYVKPTAQKEVQKKKPKSLVSSSDTDVEGSTPWPYESSLRVIGVTIWSFALATGVVTVLLLSLLYTGVSLSAEFPPSRERCAQIERPVEHHGQAAEELHRKKLRREKEKGRTN
ncbi:hypothetical protein NE237_007109 [Protea cynaroides]|uniref:Stress-response A/B barrel domain-containing protein n=1 Tax=Protea cynaroides TaxID=273540 RepID=A0A9Q0QW48_9MAGN|nr:hypothetical protein NE237_007109 [Protea cynaroides]